MLTHELFLNDVIVDVSTSLSNMFFFAKSQMKYAWFLAETFIWMSTFSTFINVIYAF